jgi:hypothetical protein
VTASAKIAPGAVLAFVIIVPLVECRQLAGIDDPNLQACGVAFAGPSCADCMRTSCCAQIEPCAGEASCRDFQTCAAGCSMGDVACTSACRTRVPTGYDAKAASLQTCEVAHCSTACKVACGGYVYPNPSCAACGIAQCCDLATKCMGDGNCSVLAACERACPVSDESCLRLCELAHPDGVADERALGACVRTHCSASCIAPKWACLEHPPTTPPATGPNITLTYTFLDYVTLLPLAGLKVRACRATDVSCESTPLLADAVLTDVAGQAVLSLASNSFDGYVEVSGPGYGPVLEHHPALTRDFVAPITLIPSSTMLQSFANAIAPLDPSLGMLIVTVRDCNGDPPAGVRLAIQPAGGVPFYFTAHVPSASATATDDDGYGSGGFVNVKVNTAITVDAIVAENGLSYAPQHLLLRAGTYSHLTMYAAPP